MWESIIEGRRALPLAPARVRSSPSSGDEGDEINQVEQAIRKQLPGLGRSLARQPDGTPDITPAGRSGPF